MKIVLHLSTVITLFSAFVGTFVGSQTWAASGIGGSGGGPRMERVSSSADGGQLVTVEVCDGGESGTKCRTVTYRVRPPSKPEVVKETCMIGEAGEGPCPEVYGVPGWLKRLNEAFSRTGESAPQISTPEYTGGP
jgi:hypothetical protein